MVDRDAKYAKTQRMDRCNDGADLVNCNTTTTEYLREFAACKSLIIELMELNAATTESSRQWKNTIV